MPRRGENIYKRKDGRWEARYIKEIYPDGRKKYGSVYGSSYTEVKNKRQFFAPALSYHSGSATESTVNEMIDRWLAHIRPQVKASSFQKYECLSRNHIRPEIGHVKV